MMRQREVVDDAAGFTIGGHHRTLSIDFTANVGERSACGNIFRKFRRQRGAAKGMREPN